MSAAPANPNQPLITLWVVQLLGTIVIAAVVLVFFRTVGGTLRNPDSEWVRYSVYAILASILPALAYLRNFKEVLDVDAAATKQNGGVPLPAIRAVLTRALKVGGVLSELPQACGVVHVLLGGETRWFLGATLITLALRLAYRPFERLGK
jgi:hypothetical protein